MERTCADEQHLIGDIAALVNGHFDDDVRCCSAAQEAALCSYEQPLWWAPTFGDCSLRVGAEGKGGDRCPSRRRTTKSRCSGQRSCTTTATTRRPRQPGLDGRHPGNVTLINVGLLDPRPHRLDAVSELRRDALHRPMLGPELGPQRSHHPDRGGLLLRRVPTRRRLPCCLLFRHNPILVSKVRSLQQTQGASACLAGGSGCTAVKSRGVVSFRCSLWVGGGQAVR